MRRIVKLAALIVGGLLVGPAAIPGAEQSPVKVVAAPDGSQPVVARTDAEGTIHLLLDAAGIPQYARSTDGGRTFSAPIAVVDRKALQPGLEFHAWDLAVGKGGRVHVALGTNAWKLKLPKEEWGYFYSNLDAGAKSFSPVRNINRHPSEGFSLAADDQGNVTACWLSDKLYANISHDGGKTFGQEVEIDSSYNPCNCCTTSCTYGKNGRLAILYREETDNERDMYLVLWDQEKGRSTRTRVSSTLWKIDACPMTYYSIVPRGDGYAASWPTEGKVYLALLDRDGQVVSPGEIKTHGGTGMRTGLVTLASPSGSTLVVWKKDNHLGWQLYDPQGKPSGPAGSSSSPGKGAAAVVDKDGGFVVIR